jgi:hypothetical protein
VADDRLNLARRAIVALYSGDGDPLAQIADDEIVVRDLNPHGLEQVHGRSQLLGVADHIAAAEGKVLRAEARAVGASVQVTYAVSMLKDGARGEFEKHAFCDVANGRVTAIDQVCSGQQADGGV